MGNHSSILAWKIPWTEDFGRSQNSWTGLNDNKTTITKLMSHKHI